MSTMHIARCSQLLMLSKKLERSQCIAIPGYEVPVARALEETLECLGGKIRSDHHGSRLDPLIRLRDTSLRRAISEFGSPLSHGAKPPGLDNKIIRPDFAEFPTRGTVRCRARLGGMLRYYYREAA
jgi:hypothetical protein